eukprot:1242975-Pleurochrysis_carterae.AAC.1
MRMLVRSARAKCDLRCRCYLRVRGAVCSCEVRSKRAKCDVRVRGAICACSRFFRCATNLLRNATNESARRRLPGTA